eukprot:4788819-Ditylum_brightwellii.AAC.1
MASMCLVFRAFWRQWTAIITLSSSFPSLWTLGPTTNSPVVQPNTNRTIARQESAVSLESTYPFSLVGIMDDPKMFLYLSVRSPLMLCWKTLWKSGNSILIGPASAPLESSNA